MALKSRAQMFILENCWGPLDILKWMVSGIEINLLNPVQIFASENLFN